MADSIKTPLIVRVIARGGKFLGDDIGGALITVRDAQTGELLAHGPTQGASGPTSVMKAPLLRADPIPTLDTTVTPPAEACHFRVDLDLERPRLLEVSAYGPLGAPQGAHTVVTSHWIYPGASQAIGDGLTIEIPGLLVQIQWPPTHWLPKAPPPGINIQANVTMMCGCPITPDNFWPPDQFEVKGIVRGKGNVMASFDLAFDDRIPYPSQFVYSLTTPPAGIYELTVYAYQKTLGNTGVNTSTFIIPSS